MDKNKIANVHEILYITDLQKSCDQLSRQLYFSSQNQINELVLYFKKDNRRYTSLHYIMVRAASDAKKRYNRLVKQLIKAGLNADYESEYGTILSGAILQENYFLFLFLLKHCNVNHTNISGRTPLFYAAQKSRLDMAFYLIKFGAYVDKTSLNFQGEKVIPIQIIQSEDPSWLSLLDCNNIFANLTNMLYCAKIRKELKPTHFKQFHFVPNVNNLNFILSKPLMIDAEYLDEKKIIEACLGRTTPLAIAQFKDAMVTQKFVNSDAINRAIILKYLHPVIKAESIYLAWKNVGLMSRLYLNPEKLPLLKDMLSRYGFSRCLQLFSDTSFFGSLDEIVDLWVELTKKISPTELKKLFPSKPKSIVEIHWVLQLLRKDHLKSKPKQLNQPMLFSQTEIGEYEIYLPVDRSDLVKNSLKLKNCLHDEDIETKILLKYYYIAVILKKGRPVFCVRYDKKSILEIKGVFNKIELPEGFEELLQKYFTPIT